jgi:hypothetical protein
MSAEISEAAEQARERLHEEIERVRAGVEEMLDESGVAVANGSATVDPNGQSDLALRAELEELRLETRDYVKRRVRKSEKRTERSVLEVAARTDKLEQRVDQVEADRARSEVRIHNDTEQMLDGLLQQVRSIADRLTALPAPKAAAPAPVHQAAPQVTPPAGAPAAKRMTPPQVPIGRVGPRVAPRRPAQ